MGMVRPYNMEFLSGMKSLLLYPPTGKLFPKGVDRVTPPPPTKSEKTAFRYGSPFVVSITCAVALFDHGKEKN